MISFAFGSALTCGVFPTFGGLPAFFNNGSNRWDRYPSKAIRWSLGLTEGLWLSLPLLAWGRVLGIFLSSGRNAGSLAKGIGIKGIGKGALFIAYFPRSKSHDVQQGLCW